MMPRPGESLSMSGRGITSLMSSSENHFDDDAVLRIRFGDAEAVIHFGDDAVPLRCHAVDFDLDPGVTLSVRSRRTPSVRS